MRLPCSIVEGHEPEGKAMARVKQHAMHCRCGRDKILAQGMCAVCYTLRRQDSENFGGLREVVLDRDGYRCRVCDAPGRGKREIIVHHRIPGKSVLNLMISLCPACHAKIHRTKAVLSVMPPLLLELWREQHPDGQEQLPFDFDMKPPVLKRVPLFSDLADGVKRRLKSSPLTDGTREGSRMNPFHGARGNEDVTR